MHRDFGLARDILGGVRRGLRVFRRRFGDEAEMAFAHYGESQELGLQFEDYVEGVAKAASGSLLRSIPARREDADLGPHVLRVFSRRDFPLSLLLRMQHPGAWSRFRERFSRHLRSLFLRCGYGVQDADDLLRQLMDELRNPDEQGGIPLDEYLGRSDLGDWLFVYVRCRFLEGRETQQEDWLSQEEAPSPSPGGAPVLSAELRAAIDTAFCVGMDELDSRDAEIVKLLAHGADPSLILDGELPSGLQKLRTESDLLDRHTQIVGRLAGSIVKGVEERLGHRLADVENSVFTAVINDLSRDLQQICGWAPELEPES